MIHFNFEDLKMRSGVFYDIKKMELGDLDTFHNGYIFMNLDKQYPYLREAIESVVETTYECRYMHYTDEYKVLGFDTGHAWNFTNPETQTYNAVENTICQIFEKWDELLKENNYGRD